MVSHVSRHFQQKLAEYCLSLSVSSKHWRSFIHHLFCFRYERVPCLEDNWNNLNTPSPLGIRSLAGVFIMLGCGLLAAILLLGSEHLFYKYLLPTIRLKPKDCFWKSPNLMFFSQVSLVFSRFSVMISILHVRDVKKFSSSLAFYLALQFMLSQRVTCHCIFVTSISFNFSSFLPSMLSFLEFLLSFHQLFCLFD